MKTLLNRNGLKDRELEESIDYTLFYKPKDGFVGDVIPYYENGIFYIFYLKDQGNSYNHSIFLVETKDFIHYEDKGLVIEATRNKMGQDDWVGTGSICKIKNKYYLFYTGHNNRLEIQEKVMIATSENDLYHFKKIDGLYISPVDDLSHRDFRDPDVYFDEESREFILTITSNNPVKGKLIVQYRVKEDLSSYEYSKDIFVENKDIFSFSFYNFECSDIFKIGKYWYLTFSCQDDRLWYAKSLDKYDGYNDVQFSKPTRLDGKYFYVPKAVSDGVNTYMIGWVRGREGFNDSTNGAWGGNLGVAKVVQDEDGSLHLTSIDGLDDYFKNKRHAIHNFLIQTNYEKELIKLDEPLLLEGDICFNKKDDFGFIVGFDKPSSKRGLIKFRPNKNRIEYIINEKKVEYYTNTELQEDKVYHFKLLYEGSIIVLYFDSLESLTTRYYNILGNSLGFFAKKNTVRLENLVLKKK